MLPESNEIKAQQKLKQKQQKKQSRIMENDRKLQLFTSI